MKKGDKITVAVVIAAVREVPSQNTWATYVWRHGTVRTWTGGRITYDWSESATKIHKKTRGFIGGTATVAYADRHKLWARGWEGTEVDALRAAVALR